jgi:RNA polymerase sigma-70 factor, ECF subfamily
MTDDNNLTDEQLLRAIKQSDPEAFNKLFQKYFTQLIRFCWYRVHDIDTSRDLVQEIFVRVWLKRQMLNPDKSIKAYLYKSLNNLIINESKLSSSQTIPLDEIEKTKGSSEINRLEFKIDIQNALDKLPLKLKTVYTLSRFEGFDYAEIAEICNISKKAVEKRMSKAFILLRKFFSEKHP